MNDAEKELLLIDYDKTLGAVDKFDHSLLQIQNWSLVTCGAVTAYGFGNETGAILIFASVLAVLFAVFALIYKAFQIDAMNHACCVERILNSGEPVPANYTFGIGHAISGATWPALRKSLTHPALWYLRAFYLILIAAPLCAMLVLATSSR